MRAFDRWRALPRRDKQLVVEAAVITSVYVARIRLRRTPNLRHALHPDGEPAPIAENEIRAIATAVDRASRYVPSATCLPRALALTWMLKRRGVTAEVRLGVRTDAGGLQAHAWVECQGMTLNGPAVDDPFVTLR